MIHFINFEEFKRKILKDKEAKKEYDALGPEFKLIEAKIRKDITRGRLLKKARTKNSN